MDEKHKEGDIDRLLEMLVRDFPCSFSVNKGGSRVGIELNGSGKRIILHRDGPWDYEADPR